MALQLKSSSLSLSIVLLVILSLYPLASAEDMKTATFANSFSDKRCQGFDYKNMEAGVDKIYFDDYSVKCGDFFEVTCLGSVEPTSFSPCNSEYATVTVMITDTCEGSECGTFNLSKEAFAMIANTTVGRIKIACSGVPYH